jgi:hypothetical protein
VPAGPRTVGNMTTATVTAPAVPAPLAVALETARVALAAHADPVAADTGTTAFVHGALTLIEAAQRALTDEASAAPEPVPVRGPRRARAA